MSAWFRCTRLHSLVFWQENEARETAAGSSPRPPCTALRQPSICQTRWNPFGEPAQTRPLTWSQTHGQVRFLLCACYALRSTKNPLTSHAKRFCGRCLGLQETVWGAANFQHNLALWNHIFAHRKLLRNWSIHHKTQFSRPASDSVNADGRPRQHTTKLTAWLVREFLPLPRTAGVKTNLKIRRTGSFGAQSTRCRSAVQKRPLLLPFPAERKRECPRGMSAFPFPASWLIAANENEVTSAKSWAFYFH